MAHAAEGLLQIQGESDIVVTRQAVRDAAATLGFGMTDITQIVTVASELARNIFRYAGKGRMLWRAMSRENAVGIELSFQDEGPGIPDVEQALQEGFTTGGGLGLGLHGTKRMMDEIEIHSTVGKGTTVTVRKWRRK